MLQSTPWSVIGIIGHRQILISVIGTKKPDRCISINYVVDCLLLIVLLSYPSPSSSISSWYLSVISLLRSSVLLSWFSSCLARLLLFWPNFPFLSISSDIKKHTSDDNPDKITLEKAIDSLKEVMTWVGATSPFSFVMIAQPAMFDHFHPPCQLCCSVLSLLWVQLVTPDCCWAKMWNRGLWLNRWTWPDCLQNIQL